MHHLVHHHLRRWLLLLLLLVVVRGVESMKETERSVVDLFRWYIFLFIRNHNIFILFVLFFAVIAIIIIALHSFIVRLQHDSNLIFSICSTYTSINGLVSMHTTTTRGELPLCYHIFIIAFFNFSFSSSIIICLLLTHIHFITYTTHQTIGTSSRRDHHYCINNLAIHFFSVIITTVSAIKNSLHVDLCTITVHHVMVSRQVSILHCHV